MLSGLQMCLISWEKNRVCIMPQRRHLVFRCATKTGRGICFPRFHPQITEMKSGNSSLQRIKNRWRLMDVHAVDLVLWCLASVLWLLCVFLLCVSLAIMCFPWSTSPWPGETHNSQRWFKTGILSIITVSTETCPVMNTAGCCKSEFIGSPTAPLLL